MSCDWGLCDEPAKGWRFWPGFIPWDEAKPGWTDPPWLPVCRRHLPLRPDEWGLAA